ncbi:MAG: type II toxin-antitoxin system VapC family toxin [Nitrospinae bacterium]|nr:type II toxin-antitoxin system VapC family toxin [Nitrospinota bacterium]
MSDYLLDTCALLWLSDGGGELSQKAISEINASRFVYISAISAWEISLLCFKEQIKLPVSPEEWFRQITENQDIQVINLTPEIAFLSNNLPSKHKDFADRFIIATAVSHNLSIVTGDKMFAQYPVTIIQ